MSRPEFFMLMGLPGCGKSTWITNLYKDNPNLNFAIISPDLFIANKAKELNITYMESYELYHLTSVQKAYFNLKHHIKKKHNIISDQVNGKKKYRKNKLAQLSDDYITTGIYFDIPLEQIMEQQFYRSLKPTNKIIPRDSMDGFIDSFEPPSEDEFDNLIIIR